MDIQSAALAAIAFLVLLFGGYYVLFRFTRLGDDGHDEESTNDRLTMNGSARHQRVGFRHRVSRQTPMTKLFLVSILVLLVYLSIALYRVAATGAPSEAVYAGYLEYALFGFICVAAGVWFKIKQDAKAGELQITLEREDGNKRKAVKFNRSMSHITEDGTTIVPELKDYQVGGLFWRPKLVADDPKRRDADHRLPEDLVMWEIPDDDSAVWDRRSGEVSVRAKRIREVNNANRGAVDYEIVPSDRKSKSEIQQLENEKRELSEELDAEKVMVSVLSERLTELQDILTNEEDAGMRKIKQAKDVLEPDQPYGRRRGWNGDGGRYDDRGEGHDRAAASTGE